MLFESSIWFPEVCTGSIVVAAWAAGDVRVEAMHMMSSALMHRTVGFASFLSFRVFAMFPDLFVSIFFSLFLNLDFAYRLNRF